MTQETGDVVALCRFLEALAGDCENTDGWEAAAHDVRKAVRLIQSLSDRIDVLRAALAYAKDYLRGELNVGALAEIQAVEARASLRTTRRDN